MGADEVLSRLSEDPALDALETGGRAAFAVDEAGRVVWAGANAGALMAEGGLDAAGARTLGRMAALKSSGLVLLRLGAGGRFAATAFHAKPLTRPDAPPLLALQSAAAVARRPKLAPSMAPEARSADVAAAEGVGEDTAAPVSGEPDQMLPPTEAAVDDDPPPDPRRDLTGAAPNNAPGAAAEEAATTPPAPAIAQAPEPKPPAPLGDVRFVFEIDAETRVTLLSPDLARAVGETGSAIGRPWGELAAELGLDPESAVAAALGRRASWGEITVEWPRAQGGRALFALSALPMFDRGRTFVGHRGFGRLVGVTEAEPAPREALLDASAPAKPLAVGHENEADQDGAPPAAAELREEPAMFAPPPAPETFTGNVVALREAAPRVAGLSSSEESAFDEIARRLRGAAPRDAAPASAELPLGPDTAEISPTPASGADWTIDDVEGRAPTASHVEELLRLIDRLPVGALVLRAGAIDHANRAALEMLGHRDLASLSARGPDALFAEQPPRDDAAPTTLRLVAADGVELDVEARLSAVSWRGGPATLVALKRAEGATAAAHGAIERERELASILDAAADGVLALDRAGRILSVNRSAEKLFGFEAREVIGGLFTLSLAPESRKAAFDALDLLQANPAASDPGREVLGLSRNGGAVPLHMTLGRVGAAGNDRFCAVLRDVTPWKRAEEELIAARRQAERANAQKSDFLAKVGHEIRTPLNAVIGFAEVMMEERFGPIGSPRYKDYLRDIHVSGSHLVGLVNDLMDITRIESGMLKLDFAAVDLNEIAAQAAALLQPQATRDRVIIRTSLARALPPVLADRRSIRQIMTNLASNAVRLSRPGGQVILATAMTDVGQAVIRVRDAGVGMTKQELARAFEPFRPLANADNDTGGGLGLPLTKALAEANEAALALQSELGQGTLAEVTFPASRVLAG